MKNTQVGLGRERQVQPKALVNISFFIQRFAWLLWNPYTQIYHDAFFGEPDFIFKACCIYVYIY